MSLQECDTIVSASNAILDVYTDTDVAIAIRDGLIVDLGKKGDVIAKWQSKNELDLGRALLMPGLINAHTHVPMTFLRGFADDLPLMDWLTKHIFPVEAHLTNRIVALGARLGMYEMMRGGTTGFVDSYLLEANVLEEADKMGIRCVAGEAVFAFPSPAYPNWEAAAELYRAQAEKYRNHSRIKLCMMPHSVYTTSDDILRQSMELAQELDIMYHIHLSESAGEVAQSKELHQGMRPVEYAKSLGLLTDRSIFAHMVDLTDQELDWVAESGAQIVHNPVSNLKLASGIAPVADMVSKNISVAIGTDGAASNNSLDMFESMKLAAILAKGAMKDATVIPAEMAFKMATQEGARAMMKPDLGVLKIGAPADMIALDLNEPNVVPLYNEISHGVYASNAKDCILTMVEGKVLYQNGTYADGLYAETVAEMQDLVQWARSKANS